MTKPVEHCINKYTAITGAVAVVMAISIVQYTNSKAAHLQGNDQIIRVTEAAESALGTVSSCVWEHAGTCTLEGGQSLVALKVVTDAIASLRVDAALQAASSQASSLYADSLKCHSDAFKKVAPALRTADSEGRAECDDLMTLASSVLVSSSTAITEKTAVEIAGLERANKAARFALATALGVLFSGLAGIAGFAWISRNKKPA